MRLGVFDTTIVKYWERQRHGQVGIRRKSMLRQHENSYSLITVHPGLALSKIRPRRTFLKTPKNILVPKNYFQCEKFTSRNVIFNKFQMKINLQDREMCQLILHKTPNTFRTTPLSRPEHTYIYNAEPTFLKVSLIN